MTARRPVRDRPRRWQVVAVRRRQARGAARRPAAARPRGRRGRGRRVRRRRRRRARGRRIVPAGVRSSTTTEPSRARSSGSLPGLEASTRRERRSSSAATCRPRARRARAARSRRLTARRPTRAVLETRRARPTAADGAFGRSQATRPPGGSSPAGSDACGRCSTFFRRASSPERDVARPRSRRSDAPRHRHPADLARRLAVQDTRRPRSEETGAAWLGGRRLGAEDVSALVRVVAELSGGSNRLPRSRSVTDLMDATAEVDAIAQAGVVEPC